MQSEEDNYKDATYTIKTDHHDPKIAKITLESFMNNNYYMKYLSNSDPKAYHEQREFCESIVKYHTKILELTRQLLENPNKQITAPVLESFKFKDIQYSL